MIQTIYKINDNLPSYTGGNNLTCYDCNDDCFLYHITDTTKQEYENYLTELEAAGYTLYNSHTIRDNYFATFTGNGNLLHVYFTEHDKITRIIVDSNTNLLQKEKQSQALQSYQTTLYQMELDYRTIDCGMCYIIQCDDGSFFIIDSAHMNSTNDHIRLYQLLRSLTPPEEKIIIAGWFFSHAHQDHICKFMDFINSDFADCIIEGLYYNFPSLSAPGNESWKESDKESIREFFTIAKNHDEILKFKLHSGQRFFIRNLEFEVLATHEDLYPSPLNRFNDTSTILLMTVDGCKTLFLGDSNVEESTIPVARFGSYMKSDIVQVAHHGYNGANVGIYFCVGAKVALYPVPQSRYEDVYNSEANKAVRNISDEIYIAGNGTVALPLPYTKDSAVIFPKEIIDESTL